MFNSCKGVFFQLKNSYCTSKKPLLYSARAKGAFTMTPTVLVVEDEPEVRSLLEYTLAKEKFKVLSAENGKKALELLETHVPDVITLDLMLPDIHGLEICKRLRDDPRFQS